jgi:hypothetical protein
MCLGLSGGVRGRQCRHRGEREAVPVDAVRGAASQFDHGSPGAGTAKR